MAEVFISHASEDKDEVARPLAAHLRERGVDVWLDECELTLGDSLRRNIDRGLSECRFGVVILSRAFFAKEWPNKELDALVAREDGREKVILPIWHLVGKDEIMKYSPMLADRLAVSTSRGMEHVAEQVVRAVSTGAETGYLRPDVGPKPDEVIRDLRKRMLVEHSQWELRRILYELEDHLTKYPSSPEGRMLRDQLQMALANKTLEVPLEAPSSALSKATIVCLIASVVVLLGLVVYLIIRWLF